MSPKGSNYAVAQHEIDVRGWRCSRSEKLYKAIVLIGGPEKPGQHVSVTANVRKNRCTIRQQRAERAFRGVLAK